MATVDVTQPLTNTFEEAVMRMMKMLIAGVTAFGLLSASPAFAALEMGWLDRPEETGAPKSEAKDVVASFPVGAGDGQIGIEEAEDCLAWGPASFDIDDEGSFWIVDGVNARVVVAGSEGVPTRSVPFREPLVGATDIDVIDGRVFVLDLAAQPSAVRELSPNGDVLQSIAIPADCVAQGVTGLRVENGSRDVDVMLEIGGSWELALSKDGRLAVGKGVPIRVIGNHADVPASERAVFAEGNPANSLRFTAMKDWNTWKSVTLTAYDGARPRRSMQVESKGAIGGVRFLGCDRSGDAFVYVDQLLDSAGDDVEAFVKVFDPTGAAVRIARIPVADIRAFPERFVRVTEDGTIYALVPTRDRVEIRRLVQLGDASQLLPEEAVASSADVLTTAEHHEEEGLLSRAASFLTSLWTPESAHAIWTQLDANDRAWDYIYNSWYCSGANYSRSCGDTRPRYITASGKTYSSVPYCWGGFDTVGGFNQDMTDGLDAGDINTSGSKKSCTSGVDCSGFVSRLWGLGAKRSTNTLPDVAYAVGKSSMKMGDAYINPGSHTMMFRYYTSGGAQVFEATTSHSYDRAVTHTRTTAELSAYAAYRYENW